MALVVTAAPVASLQEFQTLLDGELESLRERAKVATASGGLTPGALGRSAYDTIVSCSGAAGHHTVEFLGVLAAALKPGGRLIVKEAGDDEQVTKNLLLSGFPGSTASGPGVFEAQKPTWETGSKAAISLRSKPTQQARAPAPAPTTTAAATARAWVLTDGNGGVEELVDEDTLLTEEDKARPQAPPSRDDCEAGASGRKACKNCTCGRAEDEAPQIKLTTDMLENPQPTGCGNCALGDAFRCGGCPYRGLPSFKWGGPIEGGALKLPADALADDI